jgi:L-threonylcarbamoyladenylate synthase
MPATGRKPKSARRVRARGGRLTESLLEQIATDLRAGAIAIFPTETVYGLGTSAFAAVGLRKIYGLKGRTWKKPLALLVPSIEAAGPLVEEIPPEARRLARRFCPGPLTLVFKASALGRLVTGGLATIGVRVPDHPIALAILKRAGVPMATTSVNRSGEAPATSGSAAARLFGRHVDWLVDAGSCRAREASAVVDVSHYPFTVIREGALAKTKIEAVLAEPS